MSFQDEGRPVLVAVSGTDADEGAIRFAAADAALRRCRTIRLVHVAREPIPISPMLPLMSGEPILEAGHRVIDAAVDNLERLQDSTLVVEPVVEAGDRRRALLKHAEDASVVVVGRRPASLGHSVTGGSTVTGVASRSPCPVICVPPDWTPRPDAPVVAGVDASRASAAAITLAFEEATARATSLTLAHAWALPDMYADIIAARVTESQWRRQMLAVLEDLGADGSRAHPGVLVDFEVRHQPPIAALLGLSATAQLIVLGRRGHCLSSGMPLGSVARALVHRSHCPVEIAPPPVLTTETTATHSATVAG